MLDASADFVAPAAVRRRNRHRVRITALSSAGWAMANCASSKGARRQHYYVDGGFVQVADNLVSVLTNRAVPADQARLDQSPRAARRGPRPPAHSPELMAIRERRSFKPGRKSRSPHRLGKPATINVPGPAASEGDSRLRSGRSDRMPLAMPDFPAGSGRGDHSGQSVIDLQLARLLPG